MAKRKAKVPVPEPRNPGESRRFAGRLVGDEVVCRGFTANVTYKLAAKTGAVEALGFDNVEEQLNHFNPSDVTVDSRDGQIRWDGSASPYLREWFELVIHVGPEEYDGGEVRTIEQKYNRHLLDP